MISANVLLEYISFFVLFEGMGCCLSFKDLLKTSLPSFSKSSITELISIFTMPRRIANIPPIPVPPMTSNSSYVCRSVISSNFCKILSDAIPRIPPPSIHKTRKHGVDELIAGSVVLLVYTLLRHHIVMLQLN